VALRLVHRQLLVVGFDRSSARALGGKPLLADLALLALLAVTIVIGVQALGNLLVVAVVVAPAACARLVTRRILPMMGVAAGIALAGSVAGLELSYHASTAAGASVAAVLVGTYLVLRAFVAIRPS
jgi:ABC-type Mn2+/Zn2+ transport system permease subunit